MHIRCGLKPGQYSTSHFVATDETGSVRLWAAWKVETAIFRKELHDGVNIMSVESRSQTVKCLQYALFFDCHSIPQI